MGLINITPVMTSNTAPLSYVASASGIYNASYDAWKAFNGTVTDVNDSWITTSGTLTGWIQLDFSKLTKVNQVAITGRTGGDVASPKDFTIQGSQDGVTFTVIKSITGNILTNKQTKIFIFDAPVYYRYYRINITASNGTSYTAIADIQFWQSEDSTEYISNQKSSLAYCLPKNSTSAMQSREFDPREGLLGFANDDANYGTLWMVGKDGKAYIPKASMASADLIFDGSAGTSGSTYSLTKSYKNYKYLLCVAGGGTASNAAAVTMLIPTEKIVANGVANYNLNAHNSTISVIYDIFLFILSDTTFKVTIEKVGWTNPAITQIYGIK